MDGQGFVLAMCGVAFVWSLWLATCRPDAYNKLSEGMIHRCGMAGRGLLKVIGFGARTWLHHRGRR